MTGFCTFWNVFTPVVDATYEASGKHTYLPMTINSGTLVLVLVVFVVLYKHLAPRNHSAAVKELDEKITVIKSSGKTVIKLLVIVTMLSMSIATLKAIRFA